jgi:hypothetical protein
MHNATLDTQLNMKIPVQCEKTGIQGLVYIKDVQALPLTLDNWLEFSNSNDLKIKIHGINDKWS